MNVLAFGRRSAERSSSSARARGAVNGLPAVEEEAVRNGIAVFTEEGVPEMASSLPVLEEVQGEVDARGVLGLVGRGHAPILPNFGSARGNGDQAPGTTRDQGREKKKPPFPEA